MLAGLPVPADAELACGRQYVLPETGRPAAKEDFAEAIRAMRSTAHAFGPRADVLRRWTWPHTVRSLRQRLIDVASQKNLES